MPIRTTFKGITDINADWVSSNLEYGIIDFFDWATLNIGGFVNVTSNPRVSGVYGGDKTRLRPVKDPRFTDGRVWEGYRSNWVWESGLSYTSSTPINISGVNVNNVFSCATGVYSHYVDYPRGRIIFDSPLLTTDVVRADYSYKIVNYVPASYPYVREMMSETNRIDREDFLTMVSGAWSQLADTRFQLPIVALELGHRMFKPYQLGGGQWIYQDIFFFVFAENDAECSQICDIIANQNEIVIYIPDRKYIKSTNNFPIDLDYRGTKVASPKTYPDIVAATGDGGFQWRSVRFRDTEKIGISPLYVERRDTALTNPKLFRGVVQTTVELILETI